MMNQSQKRRIIIQQKIDSDSNSSQQQNIQKPNNNNFNRILQVGRVIDEEYEGSRDKNKRLNMIIIAMIIVIGVTVYLHSNLISNFQVAKINKLINIQTKQQKPQQKQQTTQHFQLQIKQNTDNMEQQRAVVRQEKPDQNVIKQRATLAPSVRAPIQAYASRIVLDDLTSQDVYKQASDQMREIFDQMIKRQQTMSLRNTPNRIFIPSEKAYFAYSLYTQPHNQQYARAEYYYYDYKYGIGRYSHELKMCIVAPGRNIAKNEQYKLFIDSINRQNYTNYKLVYVDDASDDGSPQQLEEYVQQTNGLLNKNGRLVIVRNTQRVYALANRNTAIRKHCDEDSIVADVDADDAFIGRQAFKLVNAIYQDPNVWQFNSVFIYVDRDHQQVTTGPQEGVPMELLMQNRYRGSLIWKTSELRTFKAKLFNKINQADFKNENGEFYKWASDVFTQVPLVQLAGPKHYKHLYQIMYFYNWVLDRTTVFKRRHYRDIAWMQTPYKPLRSLDDQAQKVENYVVNPLMRNQYQKNLKQAELQAQRYNRPDIF